MGYFIQVSFYFYGYSKIMQIGLNTKRKLFLLKGLPDEASQLENPYLHPSSLKRQTYGTNKPNFYLKNEKDSSHV